MALDTDEDLVPLAFNLLSRSVGDRQDIRSIVKQKPWGRNNQIG